MRFSEQTDAAHKNDMSNILFTAEQAAEYCGGKITGGNADITSVVIDSRDARGGSLFVGLKGEN